MLWIIIGSVCVALAAALSLWASYESRRDIAAGNPKFSSVADVTGIWRRSQLDAILGSRSADDRYAVTLEELSMVRRPGWKVWLDSEAGDAACIVVALLAPFVYDSSATLAVVPLVFAGLYQFVGYAWAICVMFRSGVWDEDGEPNA